MASQEQGDPYITSVLGEILASVKALQQNQSTLASTVDQLSGKVNVLSSLKQVKEAADTGK